jgi:hypothetical protein
LKHEKASPFFDISQLKFASISAMTQDSVLNFMHIPKTGGTSMETCLKRYCMKNKIKCFSTHDPSSKTQMYWHHHPVRVSNSLQTFAYKHLRTWMKKRGTCTR